MLGQRLWDLSKRGVRELEDAFFGLISHVSVWRTALSAAASRTFLTGPLTGYVSTVLVIKYAEY